MSKIHIFRQHKNRTVKLSFELEDYVRYAGPLRIKPLRHGQEVIIFGGGNRIYARDILKCPKGMLADHIDRNPFNNVRDNLRIVTPAQNAWNTRARVNSKYSSYKGVSFDKTPNRGKPWQVRITAKGQKSRKKRCTTEIEAALQYNEWAKELHKEFAVLNVIKEEGDK